MQTLKKRWLAGFLILLIASCASYEKPSIIDRSPSLAKKSVPVTTPKTNVAKDWLPDTHIVVKGDTLFSLSLQYGEYYRDIAARNNLTEPYIIKIGQSLKIRASGNNGVSPSIVKPSATLANDTGVILTPLKKDGMVTNSSTAVVVDTPPVITEPKATREVYSEIAMAAKPQAAVKPVQTMKPTDVVKTDAAKIEPTISAEKPANKPASGTDNNIESITWAWPTKGKVITQFNDTANAKGIDISGSQGQPITAAASGKVIYTGSDLRGYGKLVIIKHDKNYLSVYAHNSKILVKEGSTVTMGDKISEMGNTDTNMVKLHFEIRLQGKSIDPMKFLNN